MILSLLSLLSSCTGNKVQKYVIGVSQCSTDDWRVKMNDEMLLETFFYPGLELEIRSAEDETGRQVEDIEYFISRKVDLIIVAPNEAEPVTPVVEKALKKGIPVVVVDRKISSDNMTAFIGADNYQIGKSIGLYVSKVLQQGGNVVELTGLMSSSPAQERHKGFTDVISENPRIRLLCSEDAQFQEKAAYDRMLGILSDYENIDLVFAHNDMMAYGAYQAAKSIGMEKSISFIGIDALTGPRGGVNLVLEGVLNATFVYPTGGDQVIHLAMRILKGKEYRKINVLQTTFVDRSNAELMMAQSEHLKEQEMKIRSVNGKLMELTRSYDVQRIVMIIAVAVVMVVISLLFTIMIVLRQRNALNEEVNDRQNRIEALSSELEAVSQNNSHQTSHLDAESMFDIDEHPLSEKDRDFIIRFKALITANLSNSDMNIDRISEEMGLSRVQFYRILKRLTDLSPNEFIRIYRLKRARYLLLTTDMTISEICYETGFNTPSYFTRCFKEYFKKLPSDYSRMRD